MMSALPTIFLSHGSPMLALEDSAARRFLQQLGSRLPRPQAIVLFSAHWETVGTTTVSLATEPVTIHDFAGFPRILFDIQYPAAGAPEIAEYAAALLDAEGIAVKRSPQHGLDHGAWVPLSLMYPDADIPVLQISLVRGAGPAEHLAVGRALALLRQQGVLVIGSGSLTHNLHELQFGQTQAPVWVTEFAEWIHRQLMVGDFSTLMDYRQRAPSAAMNHPTEEHLMPLFIALGAAGDGASAKLLHSSIEHSVLAMDAYAFH